MSLTEFIKHNRQQITKYIVETYQVWVTSDAERREFVLEDEQLTKIAKQWGVRIE